TPESRNAIGSGIISEKFVELPFCLLRCIRGWSPALRLRARAKREERAEVGPVLFLHQLIHRFGAVPVRARAEETAVQAYFEILAARRAGGRAIHLARVLHDGSA